MRWPTPRSWTGSGGDQCSSGATFVCCVVLGVVALFPPFWIMVLLSVFVGLLYGPINPIGNLAMQVLTPEACAAGWSGSSRRPRTPPDRWACWSPGPSSPGSASKERPILFAGLTLAASASGFFMRGLRGLDHLDKHLPDPAARQGCERLTTVRAWTQRGGTCRRSRPPARCTRPGRRHSRRRERCRSSRSPSASRPPRSRSG